MNQIFVALALFLISFVSGQDVKPLCRSIREFGVLPTNTPEVNAEKLQAAIDWASPRGAAIYVEPSEDPYPVAGGIVLRRNVSLVGVHGPVGRGTKHPTKPQPVGSVFAIRDKGRPFLTVEASTQIRGIQFWYPDQTLSDPGKVIAYPPTIRVSQASATQGVTLSCLTFYGEFVTMDFAAKSEAPCEQILVEHCYGYPLSGQFIRIDRCYDVPRILQCHVNPGNLRLFRGDYSKAVIDAVVGRKTFAYAIDHTDNAQLEGVFAFGVYGGLHCGPATYGQMTNFNFDCVTVGIWKQGDNDFNRTWMVCNGSIIANCGPNVADIHPIWVEGKGHISITNVESFSGPNPALTTLGESQDFLLIQGDDRVSISLVACSMRNYRSKEAITIRNPNALVRAVACAEKP